MGIFDMFKNMQRYQEYYQKMIDENQALFTKFFDLHDRYVLEPKTNQNEFNTVGREILDVVENYERRLCGNSERGQYGKFSGKLAEKFRGLLRKDFPKIDFIGVKLN